MTFSRNSLCALLFFVLTSGCASTPDVFVDYDPSQSFATYRSFAWISDNPASIVGDRAPSPIATKRLKSAIESTLQAKGYVLSDDRQQADFVVSFTVGARDHLRVREREVFDFYGPHWDWGYSYFGVDYPSGFPRTEVTVHQYTEGSLAIDMFDNKRKSPVWHGSARKRLTREEQRGEETGNIPSAVATILADFPPQ